MDDPNGDDPHIGEVLAGRYRLVRSLGAGNRAHVYVAQQIAMGRNVAIKLLRDDVVADAEAVARFHQEIRAVSRLRSPHTIQFHDVGESASGAPFIAMELLAGETLRQRLDREVTIPADEVVSIAAQIGASLEEAHDAGVLHRDLKPENVYLCSYPSAVRPFVKVLDFGLARVRESPRSRVNSVRFGAVLGTPAYMAPEQARGDWKSVDERTDLWALGATMFTLAAGRFVHEGPSTQAQLAAAVTHRAPAVRECCPIVPRALAAIIDRALAFDPSERWQSARDMLQAVREAQGLPPSRPSLSLVAPAPYVEERTESALITLIMAPAQRQPPRRAWRRLLRLLGATLQAAVQLFRPERRLQH